MSKGDDKPRSRTPPPSRGGVQEGSDIEKGIDDIWAGLEPKLSTWKEGVKGALKTLVVGEIKALEKRIDKKCDDAQIEVKEVKTAVGRIEQLLAKSTFAPSLGAVALSPSSPSPPSYAAAASSHVEAPFPGPVPFPPPRPINFSPDEFNASKFWRRPVETVLFANTFENKKLYLTNGLHQLPPSLPRPTSPLTTSRLWETPLEAGLRYSSWAMSPPLPEGQATSRLP